MMSASRKTVVKSKKFKKGDMVIVIAGDDKGKQGAILSLSGDKVTVSGVNFKKKAVKGNPSLNTASEFISKEFPFSVSNIAIFNTETNERDKVVFSTADSKKIRVYKKTGKEITITK